jgi:hypothetical protein
MFFDTTELYGVKRRFRRRGSAKSAAPGHRKNYNEDTMELQYSVETKHARATADVESLRGYSRIIGQY